MVSPRETAAHALPAPKTSETFASTISTGHSPRHFLSAAKPNARGWSGTSKIIFRAYFFTTLSSGTARSSPKTPTAITGRTDFGSDAKLLSRVRAPSSLCDASRISSAPFASGIFCQRAAHETSSSAERAADSSKRENICGATPAAARSRKTLAHKTAVAAFLRW